MIRELACSRLLVSYPKAGCELTIQRARQLLYQLQLNVRGTLHITFLVTDRNQEATSSLTTQCVLNLIKALTGSWYQRLVNVLSDLSQPEYMNLQETCIWFLNFLSFQERNLHTPRGNILQNSPFYFKRELTIP